MTWFNWSVATIDTTFQLLYLYIYIYIYIERERERERERELFSSCQIFYFHEK